MKEFPIERLVFDAALWPRRQRDEARVAYLADVLEAGGRLPPIKIQRQTAVVLGGWHTVAAYQMLRRKDVPVEVVDVANDEQLLFAYREDAVTAAPYSDADVQSVAQRLYEQRSTVNGELPNVAELARDLGRSMRTVANWVETLVAKKRAEVELKRNARALAVEAFRATKLSTRRIAELIGASETQVRRDCQMANAAHLADAAIVAEAHSLIHLAIGQGATVEEMEAARDWLFSQTDPSYLKQRERQQRWGRLASEVRDWAERAENAKLPDRPEQWKGCESARQQILEAIKPIETYVVALKARVE